MEVIKGDIFQSRAQTLVNTVNCVGIMGKGLALEFKKRFPGMYRIMLSAARRDRSVWESLICFAVWSSPLSSTFPPRATGAQPLAWMT